MKYCSSVTDVQKSPISANSGCVRERRANSHLCRKYLTMGIILLFAFSTPEQLIIAANENQLFTNWIQTESHSSRLQYSPVNITTNQDFINQGWPGNGTESDPYRLSSLNIESDEICISISNTDVYFIISDSIISQESASNGIGIKLHRVTNGAISGVEITGKTIGVLIDSSSTCSISDSLFTNNTTGIDLRYTYDTLVVNNYFFANSQDSISCYISRGIIIENNAISEGAVGISLNSSASIMIRNNSLSGVLSVSVELIHSVEVNIEKVIIENTRIGIQSSYSSSLVISFCEITNSSLSGLLSLFSTKVVLNSSKFDRNVDGVSLIDSSNSVISFNHFLSNSNNGLFLYKSTNISILNCVAEDNEGSGVYLSYSKHNQIHSTIVKSNENGIVLSNSHNNSIINNTILNNYESGIILRLGGGNHLFHNTIGKNGVHNAIDNGYSNIWTSEYGTGNIWSDYSGIGSYIIPGFAGSVDTGPSRLNGSEEEAALVLLFLLGMLLVPLVSCLPLMLSGKSRRYRKHNRICVVFPGILDDKAGDSRRVLAELRALQGDRIQIDVVCGTIPEKDEYNVRWFKVPLVSKTYSEHLLKEFQRSIGLVIKTGVNVFSSIVISNPDRIHVHTNHPIAMLGAILGGRITRAKCLLDFHDLMPETAIAIRRKPHSSPLYWILLSLEKLMVGLSDHLIVTSEGQKHTLRKRFPNKEVTIIYNPVYLAKIPDRDVHTDSRRFRLVYLGELQQGIRGLELLVDEFAGLIKTNGSDLELVLIGSGDAEDELRSRAISYGCLDRIRFMGQMEHAQAIEMMAECDLAVIPYPRTAATNTVIPTKLLEAMSIGMPILATDTPQFRQVLGTNGFYFEPEKPDSLRNAILRAAERKQDLSNIRFEMIERSKKYMWDISSRKLVELYAELFSNLSDSNNSAKTDKSQRDKK
ncbi:MAG: NosD domain-containing protein [Candidatus Sifarchaeia archaeon]